MSDYDEQFREIVAQTRRGIETFLVVQELDLDWFRQNPDQSRRIRRYVPGEFDSDSGGFVGDAAEFAVLVTRDQPKVLFPLGSFDERGWKAGGLG